MSNTKTLIVVVVIVIILLAIFAFRSPAEPVSGKPIKIGFIGALSGVGAAIGEEELKGAELAVKEINEKGGVLGRPIEIVAEDVSLDKLRVGSSAARKLIDFDNVLAIVGPQWDEPAAVILPITEEAQVPTVGPDVTSDLESQINFDYFFSTWFDNAVGIKVLLAFAQEQGWSDIAVIRPIAGGFFQYTRDLFVEFAPDYNVSIVTDINVGNPLEIDYRTHITKVKSVGPDAIFMVLSDPTQCVFMKQLEELKLNVPVLSTEAAGSQSSLNTCPDILENQYFSTPKEDSLYQTFVEKFEEEFGRGPLYPTAVTSYDAVKIIVRALEKTNLEGGKVLRDEIANTKNYKGFSLDRISFDEKGFVITPDDTFEMRTVRDGKFVRVEDLDSL